MTSDLDHLRVAFESAAVNSDDPHTQNGAVLLTRHDGAIHAANRLPSRLASLPSRLERPAKYQFIEHAERRVIYAAAKAGISTMNATLYCCWFACPDCARAIIQAGIREVVGHVRPRSQTPERWLDAVVAGEAMLREAGVGMRWLSGSVGVTITFDGRPLEC